MSGVSRVALLLAGCLLAGCSSLRTDVRSEAPPGYQADAASKAASVNWSKVQTVSVGMDEYDYVPSSLNFEAGMPYRLHIENSGDKSHTYSSPKSCSHSPRGEEPTPNPRGVWQN